MATRNFTLGGGGTGPKEIDLVDVAALFGSQVHIFGYVVRSYLTKRLASSPKYDPRNEHDENGVAQTLHDARFGESSDVVPNRRSRDPCTILEFVVGRPIVLGDRWRIAVPCNTTRMGIRLPRFEQLRDGPGVRRFAPFWAATRMFKSTRDGLLTARFARRRSPPSPI